MCQDFTNKTQVIFFDGQVGSTIIDYKNAPWIHDFNNNSWMNVTSKPIVLL